jgi:hypothetical protein
MRRLLFCAVAAASILGAAAPAIASNHDRGYTGGYDIGPLGQCFDPRVCGQGWEPRVGFGYAYALGSRPYRYYRHRYHNER